MTNNKLFHGKAIVVSAIVFGLSCVTAQVGIIDLRAKVRTNPSLIHHDTFEGP